MDTAAFLNEGTLDGLRQVWITKEIEQDVMQEVWETVMFCNLADDTLGVPADRRPPIILYISSPGGNVTDAISIINIIKESITPVYTVNMGYAYSAAFLIALAGHKRFSMDMSTYLLHDGFVELDCGYANAQDFMEFKSRMDLQIKEFVLKNSEISSEIYDEKFRTEWYMFADEAKEYGFVDYILGDGYDITSIMPRLAPMCHHLTPQKEMVEKS